MKGSGRDTAALPKEERAMTFAKTGLLSAGLVGVFALGVMTGPTIQDRWSTMKTRETTVAAPADQPSAQPVVKTERPAPRALSTARAPEAVPTPTKKASNTVQTIAISMWEPDVRDRVKAVLNPGSRLEIAAEDFDSSEQFVTVAHAARNTKVPFMVLKDRVVNRGQSLAEAIHEFKPELNAKAEVQRARAAARSDLEIAS
jgi:hypothetical protein